MLCELNFFSKLIRFPCLACIFICIHSFKIKAQTPGCTDALAINYNSNATVNDGSCVYTPTSVNPTYSLLLPTVLNGNSGLILWNNNIWTHNDASDSNLYELDLDDINNYNSYLLTSTENVGWEEIAQNENHVYVGDVGNNANGNRTDLKILRVDKTSILNAAPVVDTLAFSYELQTDFTPTGENNTDFDCEAFIVTSNQIYLFTKEWVSSKTTVYSIPKTPGTHVAEYVTEYNIEGLITGATYLEEKRLIVLTGYSYLLQPFFYLLYDFENEYFFEGNKRKIILDLPFHQVEGIATENGLDYVVSNEFFSQSGITTAAQIHEVDLSDYLSSYLENLSVTPPHEVSKQGIQLYPNPVSEVLHIKLNTTNLNGLQMVIYNHVGQQVAERQINSNSFEINVRNFSAGMYYYSILKKGKSKTGLSGKFIVQ